MDTVPNVVWSGLLVAALLACTGLAHGYSRDSRVVTWHNAIWASVLFLIGTDLIRYDDASASAWLTLLTGLLAFNMGALAGLANGRSQTLSGGRTGLLSSPVRPLVTRTQVVVLLTIYIAGWVVYLRHIAIVFGLSTLWTDPVSIRGADGGQYLAAVPFPARLAMYLGALLLVILGWRGALDRPLPRPVNWSVFAFLLVSQMALLQRTNLFFGLMWLIAVHLTKPRKIDASELSMTGRQRLVAVGLTGVVALALFQYIGGALGKTGQLELQSGRVSPALARSGLTSPFMYGTSGTAAFLGLVDSRNDRLPPPRPASGIIYGDYNPQTWGTATFALPLRVIPIAEPFSPTSPFIDVGIKTNVYTVMEPFYRDWRVPGVAAGMALFGFVAAYLYRHRFRSRRFFWLQGLVLSSIFLAPLAPRYNSSQFVVMLLLIFFLTRNHKSLRRRAVADRIPTGERS